LRRRHKYTQEALAERSGISRQLIGYLLAFEKLSDEVHTVLRSNPALIGASLAGKLAALPSKSVSRIVEGLTLVAQGKLTQTKLIEWLTERKPSQRGESTVIKAGKAAFAKLQRRAGRLTIDFMNVADATSIESDIAAFLRARAGEKK
jgi:transcriptional regulator with XRE-family HTH domain